MMLDDLRGEMNFTDFKRKALWRKFGEITCVKPANWQITNNDTNVFLRFLATQNFMHDPIEKRSYFSCLTILYQTPISYIILM